MAKVTVIKAISRASVKIGDSFYTVEYGEERSLQAKDDLDTERNLLWDDCNTQVDKQIEDILNTFKKRRN